MTDPDAVAEPYAVVAQQLVARVRAEHPRDVHKWLYDAMKDIAAARGRPGDRATVTDWLTLAVVLAAAVPHGVEWTALTEWVERPDLKPHGTMAAFRRHQYYHERPCTLCRAWAAGYRAGTRHEGKEAAA